MFQADYGATFGSLSEEIEMIVRGVRSLLVNTYALIGSTSVSLECTFIGDNLFDRDTTWKKVDESDVVTSSTKYTITDGEYDNYRHTATLTINTLESSDSGEYECSSVNAGTTHTASQTLTVLSECNVL